MKVVTETHIVSFTPSILGPDRYVSLCGKVVHGLDQAAKNGDPTCVDCRLLDEESVKLRAAQ